MAVNGYQIQGTTQLQRTRALPDPQKALPDDWTMARLLTFLSAYSKQVNYYSNSSEPSGDWSSFFTSDPIVTVAVISQTDTRLPISKGVAGKDSLYDQLQSVADKRNDLEGLVRTMFEIISNLDQWCASVSHLPETSVFRSELYHSVRESFDHSAQRLKTAMAFFNLGTHIVFPQLRASQWVYARSRYPDRKYLNELLSTYEPGADGSYAAGDMATVFRTELLRMHKVYVYVIGQAQQEFNRLIDKSNHSPHIALLLAFLQLYEEVKTGINNFPARLTDFYYGDMLHCEPAPGTPDSAFVSFSLKPSAEGVLLPGTTLLSAGKDSDNLPIVYGMDHSLWVSPAIPGKLLSLYLERDPLQQEVYGADIITGMYGSNLNTKVINSPSVTADGWPVFGGTSVSSDANFSTTYADIGFAVSSPLLILSEGLRTIRLSVRLDKSSYDNLKESIHVASQRTQVSDDTLMRIINQAFTLRYTSAKGWITPENYTLELNAADEGLQFDVVLTPSDPAVSGYQADVHGNGYTTADPVIECRMQQGNFTFAYFFLYQLWIREIQIAVDVQEVRSLNLYNENGKVDPSKPFALLGVTPAKGSYLIAGYRELFMKPVTSLELVIDWGDLSMLQDGWQDYYHGYPMQVDNNSFQLGMDMLSNGRWISLPGTGGAVPLFLPEKNIPQSPPAAQTRIQVQGTEMYPIWSPSGNIPATDYSIAAQSGFLRMELLSPDAGFGQSLYAEVLTQTVLRNTKAKVPESIPNKPFVPMARSITLNYSATASMKFDASPGTVNADDGSFYHISPFAIYNAATPDIKLQMRNASPSKPDNVSLPLFLPYFNDEGNFFIGFSQALPGQSISLLFQLLPPDGDDSGVNRPAIDWYFLMDDGWQKFSPDYRPIDHTVGFLKSGIIEFAIPSQAGTNHHVMPSGYYWIRASLSENARSVGHILAIYTNAAEVTYQPSSTSQFLSKPLSLPPGSIKELTSPVEGIKSVMQPFYSFGGMMPESADAFRLRMAERLRHKNRAVLPGDYEVLALHKFSYLYKAVCIRHAVNARFTPAGSVRLLVIPSVNALAGAMTYTPRLTLSQLEEISDYLTPLASPLVKLDVINPLYETIQVRAQIEFSGPEGVSLYIRQLNTDLVDYLCPWLNNPDAVIQTGGVFSIPDLVNFIESQTYVKSLAHLSLLRVYQSSTGYQINEYCWPDVPEIVSSQPWSVFTSADDHIIMDINDSNFPETAGIGNLEVGSNFIITSPQAGAGENATPMLGYATANQSDDAGKPGYQFTINLDKLSSL